MRAASRSGTSSASSSEAGEVSNVSVDRNAAFGCCGFVERAGEEPDDSFWWSGDDEIGAVGGSWLNLHATSGRNDGHRAVAGADFDRGVRAARDDSPEDAGNDGHEPGAAELVIPSRLGHERARPPSERINGVHQALAPFRQRVNAATVAVHYAVLLEVAEPVGQQVGGYAGEALL